MAKAHLIALALIVIGLSSLCAVKENDKRHSGKDWDAWFERLFANKPHQWDGPKILLALMRLEQGSSQHINEIRKSIVDFWYEATMDKAEHCSLVYMAKLETQRDRLMQLKYTRNVVYEFARQHLVKSCHLRLMSRIREIDTLSNEEKDQFFWLGALWRDMLKHPAEVEHKWNLGSHIGYLVGEEARHDYEQFVTTWQNGICHKVMSGLNEQDQDLESFLATFDYDKRETDSKAANRWITSLEACKYLQPPQQLQNIWTYVKVN